MPKCIVEDDHLEIISQKLCERAINFSVLDYQQECAYSALLCAGSRTIFLQNLDDQNSSTIAQTFSDVYSDIIRHKTASWAGEIAETRKFFLLEESWNGGKLETWTRVYTFRVQFLSDWQ